MSGSSAAASGPWILDQICPRIVRSGASRDYATPQRARTRQRRSRKKWLLMRGVPDLRAVLGAGHAEQQELAPGMLLQKARHVENHVVKADVTRLFAPVCRDLRTAGNQRRGVTSQTIQTSGRAIRVPTPRETRAGHRAHIAAWHRVQGNSRVASAVESTGLPSRRRFSSMATSTCLSRTRAASAAPPSSALFLSEPVVSNARLADRPTPADMPRPTGRFAGHLGVLQESSKQHPHCKYKNLFFIT